jgi:uroporphyrin-III C-methyltransferase
VSDPLPVPVSAATPAPQARPDRLARGLAILAIVAVAATAWLAVEARLGMRAMETQEGGRLAELGSETARNLATLTQAQAALREAQARIVELESRVADTQEQRVALEEMYRDLARSADDRVLSKVEQILVLASQQLQLAGNVHAALAALQAADQRLARAEKLAATPLRRAIAGDMERLKAVPQVDTVGIAVKLDGLIGQADTLPLVISEGLPAPRPALRWRTPEEHGFTRAARDFWEEMKGLVRIREVEPADQVLLAPAQSYFLRENLKLRLLSARVALLARDEPSFREDLRATQAWVSRYFDPKAKTTVAALAAIRQLADTRVAIALPDVNASLAAVRTARAAREKR